jgi:hypothetical protein
MKAVIQPACMIHLSLMFLWKWMRGECPGFAVTTAPDSPAVCNIDSKAAPSGSFQSLLILSVFNLNEPPVF